MDTGRRLTRWLIPMGALITLAGYFGPWVPHAVAGLVVTGLDLGEYVKFLPSVLDRTVTLWREGFYLPLVAVSLTSSLAAYRRDLAYGWPLRALLLAVAVIAALNLLPPAWTPARLMTPEFRLQTGVIAACLIAVLFSPFLARLPSRAVGAAMIALAVAAAWIPATTFLRVLPDIIQIYLRPLHPGWGLWLTVAGLAVLAVAGAGLVRSPAVEDRGRKATQMEEKP